MDAVEQEQVTEELKDTEVTDLSEEASKEIEPVSEEITFKTKAELDEYIHPIAQGMKDKELKTVYDDLQKFKRTNEALERRLSHRDEDSKLSKLEAAETTELGDTQEVRDIQEVRRDAIKMGRENKDKSQALETTASQLQEVERHQNAFEMALKLFLPENEEFLSNLESCVKELEGADTQKEMDLIVRLKEREMKKSEVRERKPTPDSGLPSAPGGVDLNKMSARDLIKYGVTHPGKVKK